MVKQNNEHSVFVSNKFVNFSENIRIFSIYFTILKKRIEIKKNKRDVRNFGYFEIFVTRFYTACENFHGYNCEFFFGNSIFKIVSKF